MILLGILCEQINLFFTKGNVHKHWPQCREHFFDFIIVLILFDLNSFGFSVQCCIVRLKSATECNCARTTCYISLLL